MIKSGLFLCSIGLLFFVFSANGHTGKYNILNMLIGLIFIVAGGILWARGSRKEKAQKK